MFRSTANWIVQLLRVAMVGCLLALLYRPQQFDSETSIPPTLDAVQRIIPDAFEVDDVADGAGCWAVRSARGELLGRVARTLPAAANIRGYRGVTEAILVVDRENFITAVDVLFSRDTDEHVAVVRQDRDFLRQFVGWKFNSATVSNVDAVSGATLTSLSMARGILARLGQTPESLVFPEPLTDVEKPQYVRTGPLTDDIVGYQGPTELLLKVSDQGVIEEIKLRKSFDNQPYVGYVFDDRYFWKLFQGKSIREVAQIDLIEQQVEGVSGATMTSQAIAQTIVVAAKELQKRTDEGEQYARVGWRTYVDGWAYAAAEMATIAWVAVAGLFAWLGLHRRRVWRVLWLISTIVVLGLWAGNLISMSLLVGWASAGAATAIAPGLAVLVCVSLLGPLLTKSNTYCSHLCPHGAVQQIIRPHGPLDQSVLGSKKRRWQLRLSPRWQRILKWLPGVTLIAAYFLVLLRPETDVASWEPFHAYLFPIASLASIVIFLLSLIFSAFVPMGYCRYGCPTGSLLDYLRRSGSSRKVSWVDGMLVGLLVLAMLPRFLSG